MGSYKKRLELSQLVVVGDSVFAIWWAKGVAAAWCLVNVVDKIHNMIASFPISFSCTLRYANMDADLLMKAGVSGPYDLFMSLFFLFFFLPLFFPLFSVLLLPVGVFFFFSSERGGRESGGEGTKKREKKELYL